MPSVSDLPLPHIVIVGGGAGGVELATHLGDRPGRHGQARITLVDRNPTHIWKPRLHEVATGLMNAPEDELNYVAQGYEHHFAFALGEMRSVDPVTRTVYLAPVPAPDGSELVPARSLSYDYLVLAIGSKVNDFGTPGVAEHCHMLDNVQQANRLHQAFLARAFQVQMGQAEHLSVAIVGAGATGVELASELHEAVFHLNEYGGLLKPGKLSITIVDMADRVLPAVDAATSGFARHELEARGIRMMLGTKVVKVTPDALHLDNGEVVRAEIKVWASGVKGHDVAGRIQGIEVTRGNQIKVDAALRALAGEGKSWLNIFCLGDCASFTDPDTGKPVPPTAQAAHQQANTLARSLRRVLRGRTPALFRYRYKGTLVSLGADQAAGDLPGFSGWSRSLELRGRAAKLVYISLYRLHLAALYGWPRVAALTLASLLRRTAHPPIKLHFG